MSSATLSSVRLLAIGFNVCLVLVLVVLHSMSSTNTMVSVRFEVIGRVQGVWFRKYTKQKADELGVFGWVRNEQSGSVSGLIVGQRDKVEEMKHWLSSVGSPHSSIVRADFKEEPVVEESRWTQFRIER